MVGWPYPSYADRRWLGGDRGADKALASVVRALRGLVAETGGQVDASPDSLLHALAQLADIGERTEWAMLSVIGEARTAGVTWAAIGEALGVTKQAAQQRFAPYVREALARASVTAEEH
jgi:ATP/maltotriose-dependent transcriptional regulator MalT